MNGIEILNASIDEQTGTPSVLRWIESMRTAGLNPGAEFLDVLEDRRRRPLHYSAIQGLRSLAVKGELDKSRCARLLQYAEEISTAEADDEILIDTLGSVASSPTGVTILPSFIERWVDDADKRWFGFYAVGSLINRGASDFSDSFFRKIIGAAAKETSADRRTRYVELVGNMLLRRRRVVVVDDDPSFASLAAKHLRDEGAVVQTASSGDAALEFTVEEPDVWLVDLEMPKMTGEEFVLNLEKRDNKAPVLGITAQKFEIKDSRLKGFRNVVRKPVTPAHLRLAVANEIFHRDVAKWYSLNDLNLLDLTSE